MVLVAAAEIWNALALPIITSVRLVVMLGEHSMLAIGRSAMRALAAMAAMSLARTALVIGMAKISNRKERMRLWVDCAK